MEKAGSTAEKNYHRAREIKSFMKTSKVLAGFMRANPSVGFRYLVKPDHNLIWEINLVNFVPSRSLKLIEQGKETVKLVIQEGEGILFSQFF